MLRATEFSAESHTPSALGTPQYRFSQPLVAITCALMPAYTVRWHYGPLPTTLLETSILLTVIVFGIESIRQKTRPVWRTPLTLPAALFLIAGGIAVLASPDRRAGLGLYRAYLVEPIGFFIVASSVIRTWRAVRLTLAGLALAGIAVSVPNATVVLRALGHHSLNVAVAPPVVIYQTANAVALFVIPLLAVAASLLLYSLDRLLRIGSFIFLVVGLIASLLSFSRGGYLALLVIGVLLTLSHPRRAWLTPATVLGAVLVSRVPPVASRISHEVNLSDPNNSFVERTRLWGATLRMLRDHPLFGGGLSGFKRSVAPYRNGIYTEDLIYPHNLVLNFWSETGLLGLAAFIWVFVQAVRVAWRGWRSSSGYWGPIHLGVLLALAGILVHGLVDVPYLKNDLSLEFWVLLALSFAGTLWEESPAVG